MLGASFKATRDHSSDLCHASKALGRTVNCTQTTMASFGSDGLPAPSTNMLRASLFNFRNVATLHFSFYALSKAGRKSSYGCPGNRGPELLRDVLCDGGHQPTPEGKGASAGAGEKQLTPIPPLDPPSAKSYPYFLSRNSLKCLATASAIACVFFPPRCLLTDR